MDSFEARFRQGVTKEGGAATNYTGGTTRMRKPDRFIWDTREPYEQLVVADGEYLWRYDPDLEQVVVQPLERALHGSPVQLLLEEPQAMLSNYEVTMSEQGGETYFRLAPRHERTAYNSVLLVFGDGLLRGMQMDDSLGRHVELSFSSTRVNRPLEDALFSFQPPDGADVLVEE